jgi:hypothetical protein
MAVDIEKLEGRGARWANILSLIPGSYCAYAIWDQRHNEASVSLSPEFKFSIIAFLVCIGIGALLNFVRRDKKQNQLAQEKLLDQQSSKLVIYSANYAAVDGGGKRYEVDEFMRRIIAGDSLVLDVENHNFALADKNYVPLDPKPGSPKRLQVTYSYDNGLPQTIDRPEHFRMVLPEDSYVNDAFLKLIERFGDKDLLDELKDIDYAAKSEALAERKQVDGLLVPLQIEALSLAKELRSFGDSLPPYPSIPAQRHDEPNGDYMVRHHTLITEARPQWERQLYHGYANRDFGEKIASIFHRAGEEYDLGYPPDMLSRSAEIGPSFTSYGITKLAQEMEMIAIWINRKHRNEVNLLS